MPGTGHKIFPHDLPTPCAPGLWRVVGSLPFPLKRNMFLARLPDDGLLIYSAVALNEAGLAAMERLGRPSVMVVPHPFHIMDAPFYKARYPDLKVVAMPDAQARMGDLKADAMPDQVLPGLGIGFHVVPGLKYAEIALESPVEGGHALLVTDVVGQNEAKTPFLMKILGPPGGAGVARIVRWRQILDRAKVRDFLRERAAAEGLRLLAGCHGGVVTHDCAGWLRLAADSL
jgi:hypothetical protein